MKIKKKNIKLEKERFWFGIFLTLVGVVLSFLAFFTEPVGEVHGSIIGLVGEFLAIGGGLIGADAYVELKMKKMIHNHRNKIEENEYTEEMD